MGMMKSFIIFKKPPKKSSRLARYYNKPKNIIIGKRMINEVRSELPADVWVEILRRIPAADLVPVKAVCKTFYRLISDDLFTRLHLNHFTKLHPKATKSIISSEYMASHSNYYDPDKRTISVSYDKTRFNDWCRHVWSTAFGEPLPCIYHQVLDSYHGILLVKIRDDRLLLCNPITRSYKFLPSTDGSLDFGSWKIAYDDVSNQYKVSGLTRSLRRTLLTLYVFDVHGDGESHLPRITTTKAMEVGYEIIQMVSVLVHGSVYWLLITTEPGEILMGTCIIVSANVTAEKVNTQTCFIITPFKTSCSSDFFASNGMFYHLGQQSHATNYKNQLWVLEGTESKNPNPSWTMKHIIDTSHHLTSTLSTLHFHVIKVLGVFRDKVLIELIQLDVRLFQYNMSSQEFEEVAVTSGGNHTKCADSDFFLYCTSGIIEHIDSLIRF